jgi:hypothetical protein
MAYGQPYATCSACRQPFAITRGGNIYPHNVRTASGTRRHPGTRCTGSGRMPARDERLGYAPAVNYRELFPELFEPAPGEFEVKADNGRTYTMHAASPGQALERVADLHQVSVVAWRTPRVQLVAGVDPRTVQG